MVWERRSGWWDFARIAVIIARVKGGRLSAAFKHAWGRFCEKAHWFYILCREVTLRYERGDDETEPYEFKTTGDGGLDESYPSAARLPGRRWKVGVGIERGR